MPFETDERLKSYLDTNQLARERISLAVLSADRRFSDVRPRHPRGGPDGGRDIEAQFDGEQFAIGAVGFLNQASDADEQRERVSLKFKEDLASALKSGKRCTVFIFFTNVNLRLGEKEDLYSHSREKGINHCEILDRERLRIFLDSPDGLSIRYQYLQLAMSDAEQASFFARWGDDIQTMISMGFNKLERSLDRLQFLAEMTRPLDTFFIVLHLNREYAAEEIGHFRAFCSLSLGVYREEGFDHFFGRTDNPGRNTAQHVEDLDLSRSGIRNGLCGGQWKDGINRETLKGKGRRLPKKKLGGGFSSIGKEKVDRIGLDLTFGMGSFLRLPDTPKLHDLDGCFAALFLSSSLAEKISSVRMFGNEYELANIPRSQLTLDNPVEPPSVPMVFSPEELADSWVRMMHNGCPFRLDFSSSTPKRGYQPEDVT